MRSLRQYGPAPVSSGTWWYLNLVNVQPGRGDRLYLDLYFHKGETDSKIARIKKMPVKESTTEKKEVAAKTTKKSGTSKATKKTTTTKGKKKSRLA